ncbi:HNH endonuclease [Variovorax sp. 38R]|uniref:HNH endonuclease n=1 Tax=Variovorax sp. 38R TaxID=2774875 RepID=UPI001CE0DFBA|nr:HNH endonuclease [Variovorax sp. 38R]
MRQLYIFTAGDADAREHLNDSIRNPQPSSLLDSHLTAERADYLRSLLPDSQGFYAWGAVPGERNIPMWNQMQDGDIVLTVFDNRYRYVSSVIAKIHNADLARAIWGQTPEGKTWEYMYILTQPRAVDVHVTSKPVIDYLNNGYRGFSRIGDERLAKIRGTYGNLENFVEEVFSTVVPPSADEQDLVAAEATVDPTVFDSENLVDGRKKVLAEVVRRRGQPKFRKDLIKAYDGKCAVTGCEIEAVLEAAHIIPYMDGDTNHVVNGLLLRADVHTLFDLGLLKIDATGRIHIADPLFGSIYEPYGGKRIHFPSQLSEHPDPGALTKKFSQQV